MVNNTGANILIPFYTMRLYAKLHTSMDMLVIDKALKNMKQLGISLHLETCQLKKHFLLFWSPTTK